MTTVTGPDGILRHSEGSAEGGGRFAALLANEAGKLTERKTENVKASAATADARSRLAFAEGFYGARAEILENDKERLARSVVNLAVRQLSESSDGPLTAQFELFNPDRDPAFMGAQATEEQLDHLKALADGIRSDETLIERLGSRGEVTVYGDVVTVNISLINDGLPDTHILARLRRNKYWAQTAYDTQWHETRSAANQLTEAAALVFASEITDRHPTADAIIVAEDGSNIIVADAAGQYLDDLPNSDAALFFSQHTGNSPVRLLPGPDDNHPALTAGYPSNLVFSIPGIREINEQTS